MNEQDATLQQERLTKFRQLEEQRKNLYDAIMKIRDGGPRVSGSGPFTGNARESRTVLHLRVSFSQTLGGAEMTSGDYSLHGAAEACDLGNLLVEKLNAKLNAVKKAMEEI
jgi:hypothetical protein